MKIRFILLLALLINSAYIYSQATAKSISFEERVFNFGRINENKGRVSHTFTFLNKGNVPVVIEKIATGCGCTTYSYTKAPIKPGQKGNIIVSFDPEYRKGFFSKEITVFSNNNNISRVWIKGYIMPAVHPVEEDYPYSWGSGLYTNLKVLAFGEVSKGKSKQIRFRYANDTNKPMVLTFTTDGNNRNLKFTSPGILPPKKRGEMMISYYRENSGKQEIIRLYPVINNKKLSKYIEVRIKAI